MNFSSNIEKLEKFDEAEAKVKSEIDHFIIVN